MADGGDEFGLRVARILRFRLGGAQIGFRAAARCDVGNRSDDTHRLPVGATAECSLDFHPFHMAVGHTDAHLDIYGITVNDAGPQFLAIAIHIVGVDGIHDLADRHSVATQIKPQSALHVVGAVHLLATDMPVPDPMLRCFLDQRQPVGGFAGNHVGIDLVGQVSEHAEDFRAVAVLLTAHHHVADCPFLTHQPGVKVHRLAALKATADGFDEFGPVLLVEPRAGVFFGNHCFLLAIAQQVKRVI